LRRALLIVNPIAGQGAGQRGLGRLEQGLRSQGIATSVTVTRKHGDAREAATQAAGHDLVVVIGGDGTLNEVLNGLGADVPVALFPLGTGNVLAKELRLPRRAERFCAMVGRGRERALDLAEAEGRRFVSMAGVGFDAEVASALAARRRGAIHILTYVGPLVRCLATYRFPRLRVSIDGAEAIASEGFALVSNVRCYGGPLVITPAADPGDGVLDVCVLGRGTRLAYLRALFAFYVGWPRALGGARYYRGREVRVTAEERVPYQVDGDPAGFLPATFRLPGRTLRFVVP
jgi:YegS/Rv2252/BmrU family lipid kinase